MADTQVQLGDFIFKDFEVPDHIPWGGEQRLKVHELIGGQKVVDAMGWFPKSLSWSGRFRGPAARDRALYVQGLFSAGKAVTLTWDAFRYSVNGKTFDPDFERFYEVPYSLTLEVIQDLTNPVAAPPTASVDEQVGGDLASAQSFGANIGDAPLNASLGAIATAISVLPSLIGATEAQINTVLTPIVSAQVRTATLASTATATLQSVSTFGGMVTGGVPSTLATTLTAQSQAMSQIDQLNGLSDVLTRMSTNLQADGASGAILTQAGGNLYAIAAKAYGDPSEWITLALANDLEDPLLTGVNTLRVPAQPSGLDGVWPI